MKYTLIINQNAIMRFHILAVAELYRSIHGGTIFESTDDGDILLTRKK